MKNNGIDRRSFIVLGSSAVAGLAAFPLRAQTPGAESQLFVGFSSNVVRSRAVSRRAAASVYAAETISKTEPSFVRTGARLSFRGLQRKDESPLRLHIDVMHKADGLEANVPYHAWTYDSTARSVKSSSPVGFNVPIDSVQPLELNLVFSRGGSDVPRKISLTVANAEGAIPLNSGHYILAISDGAPDWSSLSLAGEKLVRAFDASPAGFDYLILSVSTPTA